VGLWTPEDLGLAVSKYLDGTFGESVLDEQWAGSRNKRMKGALTLFAQDADSKLILYTAADIQRKEADDQVLGFLSFWKKVQRGIKPTFVFDSKFTTYPKLSALNQQGIRFITLRRRGKNMLDGTEAIESWKRIHIPHAKRKYPNPSPLNETLILCPIIDVWAWSSTMPAMRKNAGQRQMQTARFVR
jgi:hypothetical protein